MADEEKPKVVGLFNREAYREQTERTPPATDGIDTGSIEVIDAMRELLNTGETVGCVGCTLDAKTGEPLVFIQFQPDTLPRLAALQFIGLLEELKSSLLDFAKFGPDTMTEIDE